MGPDPRGPASPSPAFVPVEPLEVIGTVWVHGATGVEPARSGTVNGWIETPFSLSGHGTPINGDGSYRFMIPAVTRFIQLGSANGYQPCAVVVSPNGQSVTADVHLVAHRAQLNSGLPAELSARQPVLTGQVYEEAPGGRRPIAASVILNLYGGEWMPIAETVTDASGRYVLCGVPDLNHMSIVVQTELGWTEERFRPGTSTLDIRMRR